MKKVSKILAGTIAGLALALSLAFAPFATIVGAACNTSGSGGASTSDPDCIGSGGIQGGANAIQNDAMSSQLFGPDGTVTKIITIVVFIIGALCVGFLVFGGIQYILSAGDSAKVTKAKNTILYAIIGLIICIVAYAIVQFILKNIQ